MGSVQITSISLPLSICANKRAVFKAGIGHFNPLRSKSCRMDCLLLAGLFRVVLSH
jgi:hypothetical protein